MTGAGNLWLLEVKLAGIVFISTQCYMTKECGGFLEKRKLKVPGEVEGIAHKLFQGNAVTTARTWYL